VAVRWRDGDAVTSRVAPRHFHYFRVFARVWLPVSLPVARCLACRRSPVVPPHPSAFFGPQSPLGQDAGHAAQMPVSSLLVLPPFLPLSSVLPRAATRSLPQPPQQRRRAAADDISRRRRRKREGQAARLGRGASARGGWLSDVMRGNAVPGVALHRRGTQAREGKARQAATADGWTTHTRREAARGSGGEVRRCARMTVGSRGRPGAHMAGDKRAVVLLLLWRGLQQGGGRSTAEANSALWEHAICRML
jgi:hypothetical protein